MHRRRRTTSLSSTPTSPNAKRAKIDPDLQALPLLVPMTTSSPDTAHGLADTSRQHGAEHIVGGGVVGEREKDDDAMMDEGEEWNENQIASARPVVEPQVLPQIKYEYLDHTADVQIHAWGDNLAEAFEQCAMGMFGYITDLERVDNFGSEQIEASGHDMLSLLYGFLDEWLFIFSAEPNFVARKISITSFDRENFKISAIGYGETFNLYKHTQGTEVKAITYSNMQFHEKEDYAEVFVIIDI